MSVKIGMAEALEAFEKAIKVKFKDRALLHEALTHRSYLNEVPTWPYSHNERLEYLGDAVLELAVSEELFRKFPDFPEGQLTVLRAALVNYQMLSKVAMGISMEKFILMSKGERADTSKARDVILANACEALIGALYLDQGFTAVKHFANEFVMIHLDEILRTKSYKDAKSELQELIQDEKRLTPTYRVLDEKGPAHRRIFTVGVYFGDQLIASGSGSSKQEGELKAAQEALRKRKS